MTARKFDLTKQYTFELNQQETKRFEEEFLKEFWDAKAIPDEEQAQFKVWFTIDFSKKPLPEPIPEV